MTNLSNKKSVEKDQRRIGSAAAVHRSAQLSSKLFGSAARNKITFRIIELSAAGNERSARLWTDVLHELDQQLK